MTEPTREELLALYKSAVEEYRFEITLGWDRQKVFLALNPTLLGVMAAFSGGLSSRGAEREVSAALVVALLASACGIFVIGKTHEYYQNAKRALFAFEEALLLPTALRIQTTSGMRESQNQLPVKHRPKAVHAVQMVLAIYVLVDLWLLARL